MPPTPLLHYRTLIWLLLPTVFGYFLIGPAYVTPFFGLAIVVALIVLPPLVSCISAALHRDHYFLTAVIATLLAVSGSLFYVARWNRRYAQGWPYELTPIFLRVVLLFLPLFSLWALALSTARVERDGDVHIAGLRLVKILTVGYPLYIGYLVLWVQLEPLFRHVPGGP